MTVVQALNKLPLSQAAKALLSPKEQKQDKILYLTQLVWWISDLLEIGEAETELTSEELAALHALMSENSEEAFLLVTEPMNGTAEDLLYSPEELENPLKKAEKLLQTNSEPNRQKAYQLLVEWLEMLSQNLQQNGTDPSLSLQTEQR